MHRIMCSASMTAQLDNSVGLVGASYVHLGEREGLLHGQVGDKRLQADLNACSCVLELFVRTTATAIHGQSESTSEDEFTLRDRIHSHGAGAGPIVRAAKGVRLCEA